MCDAKEKLKKLLQDSVSNIENDKKLLDDTYEIKTKLNDLVLYTNGVPSNIFNYDNSDILIHLLEKVKSNKKEFDAYKYVYFSPIDEMKVLPQYAYAEQYINNIYDYVQLYKEYIDREYEKANCLYKRDIIYEKYLHMFENDNIFIDKPKEFLMVLDEFIFVQDEKIAIIKDILHANNKTYIKMASCQDKDICCDINECSRILEENKEYLKPTYMDLLDYIDDYIKIDEPLDQIINDDLSKKINIHNVLLAKKVWLIKKLNVDLEIENYDHLQELMNEVYNIDKIEERIKDIVDNEEIINIIKGEC